MAIKDESTSVKLGAGAVIAGLLSAFGSFMIYATSTFMDPPGWVRIPTMALFPLGALASLGLGALALPGKGRSMAIVGWVACFAGLAIFVYAIVVLS